ncbi:MAG: hypothetical protein EXR97_03020 [Nitrospiraceae bacterium]|nr:hypothetical protein [Nitrospiraceae bacterium]MSR24817.1 hypothetical protein [Nitrospiraceae bacterium]
MAHRTTLILLLATLMGAAAFPHALGPVTRTVPWEVFLFGLPLALIGCLLANQRWALMAAVMYGTVGLALDISTIVQGLTKPDVPQTILITSEVTVVLNFLVIVFGGKGFLAAMGASSPPGFPRPNPPSPSSS